MINFRAVQVLYEFERGRESRQDEARSNELAIVFAVYRLAQFGGQSRLQADR